MNATLDVGSVLEAAKQGDASGLLAVPKDLLAQSARDQNVLNNLLALCDSTSTQVVSASWKCLVPVASDAGLSETGFQSIVQFMYNKLRSHLLDSQWGDSIVMKTARFFAAHFVTVVRNQPGKCSTIVSADVVNLYMELHCLSSVRGAADTDNVVRGSVLPRLANALSAMVVAENCENRTREEMLLRCASPPTSLEALDEASSIDDAAKATACLAATLTLLRDVHWASGTAATSSSPTTNTPRTSFDVSAVTLLRSLLLWLPGMHLVIPSQQDSSDSSSPTGAAEMTLLAKVAALSKALPPHHFTESLSLAEIQNDSSRDLGVFQLWWQVAVRVLFHFPGDEQSASLLVATLIAALFVPSETSLERVVSLFSFAMHFSPCRPSVSELLVETVMDGLLSQVTEATIVRRATDALCLIVKSGGGCGVAGASKYAKMMSEPSPVAVYAACWLLASMSNQQHPTASSPPTGTTLDETTTLLVRTIWKGLASEEDPTQLGTLLELCIPLLSLIKLDERFYSKELSSLLETPCTVGTAGGGPTDGALLAALCFRMKRQRIHNDNVVKIGQLLLEVPALGGANPLLHIFWIECSTDWSCNVLEELVKVRSSAANALLDKPPQARERTAVLSGGVLAYQCGKVLHSVAAEFQNANVSLSQASFETLSNIIPSPQQAKEEDAMTSAKKDSSVEFENAPPMISAGLLSSLNSILGGELGSTKTKRKRPENISDAVTSFSECCSLVEELLSNKGHLSKEEVDVLSALHAKGVAAMKMVRAKIDGQEVIEID